MHLGFGALMGMGTITAIVILIVAVWSIVWKGFALWISAQESKKWWFIPILIFNTAGILEIIYIFLFSDAGDKFLKKMRKKYFKKSSHIHEHSTSE